ncbi:MAG: IMP dehydrogenase [Mycoplasmoidaceae bacterium]|nr:IMP dehydrogenase [Mycoplasmoidaceae bacterium]
MSYKDTKLFGIREVAIYPKAFTTINSRSECNPYVDKMLPLFTAPMSSVIDEESAEIYAKNKINPIIPRNISFETRIKLMSKYMVAISLSEANNYFIKNAAKLKKLKHFAVLIDIANGHMKSMQDTIRKLRQLYKDKIEIMCGNIANPVTFRYLSEAGADYIRVGIGGGSGCLTASNTGIFYPMGSLILGCKKIQKQMMRSYKLNKSPKPAKIVADGGMKNYDYIIKALFLGADYVMCGRIFSQAWEAPGEK